MVAFPVMFANSKTKKQSGAAPREQSRYRIHKDSVVSMLRHCSSSRQYAQTAQTRMTNPERISSSCAASYFAL